MKSRYTIVLAVAAVMLLPLSGWAVDTAERAPTRPMTDKEEALLDEAMESPSSGEATWPGPDGFGYSGATCTYDWVDVSGTGSPVALEDENRLGPFALGFSFTYYGTVATDVWMGSNGWLSIGVDDPGSSDLSNDCPLPNTNGNEMYIAGIHDDLDQNTAAPDGMGYYEAFAAGACPWGGYAGACFVAQWQGMYHYASAGDDLTFEIILLDDGRVIIQIADPGDEAGDSSTTGIEGLDVAADHGLTYVCNTAGSIAANDCVEFMPPTGPVLGATKTATAAAMPGDTVTYTVDIINGGVADSTATTMVDPIPAGMTYVAASCTATSGTCTYNGTDDQVEWSGTVAVGATETITFEVTVDSGAACGTPILNTATIDDPDIDTPVTADASTTVWNAIPVFLDFEADDGGLVAGADGEWEWGAPDAATYPAGPAGAYSGSNVWGTDLDDEADDDVGTHTLSWTVTVPVTSGFPVELQWWDWYGDEAADERQIYIDGTLVWDDAGGTDQTFWAPQSLDLTPWEGQTITVDFVLEVCCSGAGPEGWYIDDLTIVACPPEPGVYLTPETTTASGCPGVVQYHTLSLYNNTGSDGTFDMTYSIAGGDATFTGPATVSALDGETVDFTVEVAPDVCVPDATVLTATVEADGNTYLDTATIEKTIDTDPSWQLAATTPLGVRYHAAVYHNGMVYQIGGETGWWTGTDEVHIWDVASDTWTVGAAIPIGVLYGTRAAAIGDTIYVVGGNQGSLDPHDPANVPHAFTDAVLMYDTTTDTWSQDATDPAPVALAYHQMVAHNGLLYVIGGQDLNGTFLDTVYVYDPAGADGARWSTLAPMTNARAYAAAGVIGDEIYVGGGWQGGTTNLAAMEIYDVATDTWTAGVDLPDVGSTDPAAPPAPGWSPWGSAVIQDRYLFIFGGSYVEFATGTTYGTTDWGAYYDASDTTWTYTPDLPEDSYGAAAATDGDAVWKVSGRSNFAGTWGMDPDVLSIRMCPMCIPTLWLEDFETNAGEVIPADWGNTDCTGGSLVWEDYATSGWSFNSDYVLPTEFAAANSDAWGTFQYDAVLCTPILDLSAITDPEINFEFAYRDLTDPGEDLFEVWLSCDNMATATMLGQYDADYLATSAADFDISACTGSAQTVVCFRYWNADASWDWYVGIDNVALTGIGAPIDPDTQPADPCTSVPVELMTFSVE